MIQTAQELKIFHYPDSCNNGVKVVAVFSEKNKTYIVGNEVFTLQQLIEHYLWKGTHLFANEIEILMEHEPFKTAFNAATEGIPTLFQEGDTVYRYDSYNRIDINSKPTFYAVGEITGYHMVSCKKGGPAQINVIRKFTKISGSDWQDETEAPEQNYKPLIDYEKIQEEKKSLRKAIREFKKAYPAVAGSVLFIGNMAVKI